jgi:P-type Cu+ transporter
LLRQVQVADGSLCLQGNTTIDESMVTGESAPVRKGRGDAVTGGTVVRGGAVVMRVAAVGADSALAAIARLVAHAQMSKAPVQALLLPLP